MKEIKAKGHRLLKNKLYIFIISLFALLLILFAVILIPRLNRQILEERKNKLRTAVDIAYSLVLSYEREHRAAYDWDNREAYENDLSLKKAECLALIEKFRYEKNEYYFIMDGNGSMLMNPYHQELIGANMMEKTDHRGHFVFKEVVLNAMRDDEVFVDTLWQSKYNDKIYEEQILYGEYFWPWDWIICSTLFTQDIIDTYRRTSLYIFLYALFALALIFFLLFLFINSQVTKPLRNLLRGIYEIQNNNLDFRVESLHDDEIGYVSQQFNRMVENRKYFEEQLVQSQKLEIVGTLASGVSHDFNNVIGSIAAVADVLNESLEDNSPEGQDLKREYLETILLSCDRASSIVNQLLTFSGKQKIKTEKIDLNDVFKNTEALCRISLDKSIKLSFSYSQDKQFVNGDSVQLEQTIFNLCINAGHAMTIMRKDKSEWGGKLSLTKKRVSLPHIPGDYFWQIEIKDNGVGMSETIRNKIFDPFFTTKGEGKGSGLGLAMANKIIREHHGWINVESIEGVGTVFSLFIPCLER